MPQGHRVLAAGQRREADIETECYDAGQAAHDHEDIAGFT